MTDDPTKSGPKIVPMSEPRSEAAAAGDLLRRQEDDLIRNMESIARSDGAFAHEAKRRSYYEAGAGNSGRVLPHHWGARCTVVNAAAIIVKSGFGKTFWCHEEPNEMDTEIIIAALMFAAYYFVVHYLNTLASVAK